MESQEHTETHHTPAFLSLRIWTKMLEDAQNLRIAMENRVRRAPSIDSEELKPLLDQARATEDYAKRGLRAAFRTEVPEAIREWQSEERGIGEHLLAKLLGYIGHPRIAYPHHWEGEGEDRELIADEPFERTVSDLWSYCGYGDPDRKRRKGMSAEAAMALGNPEAKKTVHLLAEGCVKAGVRKNELVDDSDGYDLENRYPIANYGKVYLSRRHETLNSDRDWTDGHMHNDALRIVKKEILRDLWIVAGETTDGANPIVVASPSVTQT